MLRRILRDGHPHARSLCNLDVLADHGLHKVSAIMLLQSLLSPLADVMGCIEVVEKDVDVLKDEIEIFFDK